LYCQYGKTHKQKTMKNSQITIAETLGMINHEQGMMRVPAHCKELMNMLTGRKVGETPKNEASSIELMDAWTKGWDKAKIIMMKEKFGF
jgi:hypothetical protein